MAEPLAVSFADGVTGGGGGMEVGATNGILLPTLENLSGCVVDGFGVCHSDFGRGTGTKRGPLLTGGVSISIASESAAETSGLLALADGPSAFVVELKVS